MNINRFVISTGWAVFTFLTTLQGNPVRDQHVEAELVSEVSSIQPGTPFTVALRLKMDPRWHTYWTNPGDAGLPTVLDWNLPEGFSADAGQWPVPLTFKLGGVTNYGYEGEIFHLVTLTPPEKLRAGASIALSAHATWLMCEDVCIPGKADLDLVLPVENSTPEWNGKWHSAFQRTRKQLPGSSPNWGFKAYRNGSRITLLVLPRGGVEPVPESLYFFSSDSQIDPDAAQTLSRTEKGLRLSLKPVAYAEETETLSGVLFAEGGWPPSGEWKGLSVEEIFQKGPPPGQEGTVLPSTGGNMKISQNPRSFSSILLLAFIGGLILNLMPCVFPVLGLKVLGLVKRAGATRRRVTLHGLVYTFGILLSFWILSGLLIVLRSGGKALGWGFQLQNPIFVFSLAILLFIFALNLSGLFEVGASLIGFGSNLMRRRGGLAGSFISGVLATVVATPCAAPFLAPALGAALTLQTGPSILVFTFIGLGLSLPFLILSLFPNLIKVLPQPGSWMETFKELMAFPLYGTVGYLVWVLAGQLDEYGFLCVIFSLVFFAAAGWVYGKWATPTRTAGFRRLAQTGALALFLYGFYFGYPIRKPEGIAWQPWSPEKVAASRAEGFPVFVDFTARWCATCQTNKKLAFSSPKVLQAFKEKKIVAFKADWTNQDPQITAALAAFNRTAVPFNILYQPGRKDPTILPEILTPGIVLEAINPL